MKFIRPTPNIVFNCENQRGLKQITKVLAPWAFTFSKLTIETVEQGVKYVQS